MKNEQMEHLADKELFERRLRAEREGGASSPVRLSIEGDAIVIELPRDRHVLTPDEAGKLGERLVGMAELVEPKKLTRSESRWNECARWTSKSVARGALTPGPLATLGSGG